ncbi:MAG: adenosylhomocysteinase [Bryobacteraceae bacterium]
MTTNATVTAPCDVKDITLADAGRRRADWAFQQMPVLRTIRKQFIKAQPFAGIRVSACMEVTPETANLMITLRDGGANIVLCAASPESTQDEVAASLVRDYGIPVYAIQGAAVEACEAHVAAALDHKPQITMDDGAGLVTAIHARRQDLLGEVLGGTERTASGAARLQSIAAQGALGYPVISVSGAQTQYLFDNRYGTGQSTLDGVIRATNLLIAGLNVVVSGYGWCGRGVAMRARGYGASVIVTEIDPIKAIEAVMDGCRVMTMTEASAIGDVFITVTGSRNVIGRDHFDRLKSGAILCNSGHNGVEIDVETLGKAASSRRETRENVAEFSMRDGRKIYVLGEGRLINLASGEGRPASVMDMSFANQAMALEYLLRNHATLEKKVHQVPAEIDKQVAGWKLDSMGIKIDRLTAEQEKYQVSWQEGI